MIEQVIFTAEASRDLTHAYRWYESRESGLGEDFLRSVQSSLRKIQQHPLAFPLAIDPFRRALIRRFPFEIFYEPTEKSIMVLAVFHCARDPSKWRGRMGRDD